MNSLESQTAPESAPKRASKKRHAIAWGIVLLICAILLVPMLHRSKPVQSFGPPPPGGFGGGGGAEVNTAKVATGSMDIFIDALGTVTPQSTVNVYSLVNGRVLAVNYREGQMVEKGQSLVEIDPRTYEAQLRQAEGALKRDQATLDQARVNLKRYQAALDQHAVSEQTVFDQGQSVKQLEGVVENDEGVVQYNKVLLSYCHVTAPTSGRIGFRLIDTGNVIFAGSSTTLAVITQVNPITAVFSIAEDRVNQVQERIAKGATLKVDLYDRAQTNKLAGGTLLTLDNAVDTTTGTVKLRALFDNSKGTLFPNQFVNARLLVGTMSNALLIPTIAIQYNGPQAYVYQLDSNNVVSVKNITVLNSEKGNSAVEGLQVGDVVVISNFDRVQEGAAVKIAGVPGARGTAPGAAPSVGAQSRPATGSR